MEPLKPRDKVTQHMTRDGLTLDNQTTGERPKAGCILTRWRKPLPSSNQTRPAAPYRKPGFTSTEKSMR